MPSTNIDIGILSISLIICLVCVAEVRAASINVTDAAEDRAFKSTEVESGRTFGAIKRFQSALLPIAYKLGVMSAVIMMTLFLAFKGVFIGTLILVLNLTFFAIKFGSYLKADHHHQWSPPSHGWSPPVINHGSGWAPHKDVHLHIHNAQSKPDLIPYSTLGSSSWVPEPHSNAIEPQWSTSGYVHSGRSLLNEDLPNEFAHVKQADAENSLSTINKSRRFIERRMEREPTIVMAQQNVKSHNLNQKRK